jgi:hypothetical protein
MFGVLFLKMFQQFMRKRYPYDVLLVELRNGGPLAILDTARVKREKDGSTSFYLKKEKRLISPPNFRSILNGVGGRGLVQLFAPNRDELHQVSIIIGERGEGEKNAIQTWLNKGKDKEQTGIATDIIYDQDAMLQAVALIAPEEMKQWYLQQQQAAIIRYKQGPNPWVVYAPYLSVMIAGAIFIVLGIIVSRSYDTAATAFSQAVGDLSKAMTTLATNGLQVHANLTSASSQGIVNIPGIGPVPPP